MNREILNIVNKVLSEEISGRIKKVKGRIFESDKICSECGSPMTEGECMECGYMKESEMEEGFDDSYVKRARGGKDFSKKEFKKIPKGIKPDIRNLDDDSVTPSRFIYNKINKSFEDLFGGEFNEGKDGMCECGGYVKEGECMECGKSGMYEAELDEFEDEDFLRDADEYYKKRKEKESNIGDIFQGDNPEVMKQMLIHNPESASDYYDVHMKRKMKGEMEDDTENLEKFGNKSYSPKRSEFRVCDYCWGEGCPECYGFGTSLKDPETNETEMKEGKKLSKGQEYIARQAEPKKKIDDKDFAKLRSKKSETKEGKKFPDLSGDGRVTRKDILLGRGVKLNGKKKMKESVYGLEIDGKRFIFNESEMVDIIENIVLEEKKKKKTTKTKNVTKDSQSKSKKQNDDYIDSVVKKMKDYLKGGSKGEYKMDADHFPKGNGELAKMKKMAYIPSDAVGEYIDNFTAAGLENLDYDAIHPNEKWVDDLTVGSSRTGNNPKWGNAVETPVNAKRNKIRKDNLLAKIKRKAYNKSAQPVLSDKSGEETDKASKIMMKLESEKEKKVLSDIDIIKDLMTYNKKTQ